MNKVSCLIPAYNEEKTIFDVVNKVFELKKENLISEIIVVSDGSKDKTVQLAKLAGADKVIELSKNIGKSGALIEGIKEAKGDIFLFLDADLTGLEKEHIKFILEPIIKDIADMVIGYIENQMMINLSGQRALKRYFLENLLKDEKIKKARYNWEMLVNMEVKKMGGKILYVYLQNLDHLKKTKKYKFYQALIFKLQLAFGFLWFYLKNIISKLELI
jgi:glycosyltransferase involved in cell wall biosynthesis